MSITQRILPKSSSTSSVFDEAKQEFLPVDKEALKRKLDLSRIAKKNGMSGIPPASSKSKDAVTLEIEQEIHDCIAQARDHVRNKVDAANQSSELQFEQARVPSINARFSEQVSHLRKTLETQKDHFNRALQKARRTEAELRRFREENLRQGHAGGQSDILGWIALFSVIELAITIFVLGSVHPESYLGITTEALLFSLVNFFIALWLGIGTFRYCLHVNFIKRLFAGWIGTALLLGLLAFFNFMLVHYRHVVSSISISDLTGLTQIESTTLISQRALQNFMSRPFDTQVLDMMSVIAGLASASLAFGLATKFLDSDDRYPGYGKIQRKADRTQEEVDGLRETLIDHCNSLQQAFIDDNHNILKTSDNAVTLATARRKTHKELLHKYNDWLDVTERTANLLLQFYREENVRHREKPETVLCFQKPFTLSAADRKLDLPKPPVPPDLEETRAVMRDLEAKIKEETEAAKATFKEPNNLSINTQTTVADIGGIDGQPA